MGGLHGIMTRPKYTTRKILLRSDTQVQIACAAVKNAPLDNDNPLLVTIGEAPKGRGLDANGYYWMRLGEIAEQAWFDGKQYSKEVWHEYCRQKVMPETVTIKDGSEVSKWVESPTGKAVVISTTMLDKKCFADYTEACEAFGASMGVLFSTRPE